MDQILERHKQEKKALQVKIQSLKHRVPKGDKKRKKELAFEIASLEKNLKEQQEKELKAFKLKTESIEKPLEMMENLNLNSNISVFDHKQTSISKANRKREKKASKEKEKEAKIAAEEKLLFESSLKKEEEDKFQQILNRENLSIFYIPSDGDCLYKALEHQLNLIGIEKKVTDLRKLCSSMLKKRKDEFLPFLISNESDSLMNDSQFEEYCYQIENSKSWGGNVELQALSYALELPIKVLQANGPSVNIGFEQFKLSQTLLLSYHRHAYQLGEHYNSIIKANQK